MPSGFSASRVSQSDTTPNARTNARAAAITIRARVIAPLTERKFVAAKRETGAALSSDARCVRFNSLLDHGVIVPVLPAPVNVEPSSGFRLPNPMPV